MFNLSDRQLQIAILIAKGKTYQEVANELCIAYGTVKTHCEMIRKKIGIKRNTQLAPIFTKSQIIYGNVFPDEPKFAIYPNATLKCILKQKGLIDTRGCVLFNEETWEMKTLLKHHKISYLTVQRRMQFGWNFQQAVTTSCYKRSST